MITPESIGPTLDKFSPPEWSPGQGIVVVVENEREHGDLRAAIRKWANSKPQRWPHYSVSTAGLLGPRGRHQRMASEFDLAKGGVLVLDEFDMFDISQLEKMKARMYAERPDVAIIGIAEKDVRPHINFKNRMATRADALEVEIIRPKNFVTAAAGARPDPFAIVALEEINKHRRAIGQRPLDPKAAGWTDQDLFAELKRIRSMNPRRRRKGVRALKRSLLR